MSKKDKDKEKVTCNITKVYGYLNEEKTKVVADISWNGRPEKLEVRKCWMKDGELQVGAGIALTEEEVPKLQEILTIAGEGKPKKRKAVDFNEVFSDAEGIIEKRDAGFTTVDGFVTLRKRPGVKLK